MIPTRRRLLATGAVVLAAPALPRFARGAEFAWRLGHAAPENFPLHKRLVEAAAEITKATSGRVEITVVPDSGLGGPLGLLSQVRGGTVEATPMTGLALAGALGSVLVQSVGFAFSGYKPLWEAMDGDLGKALRGQLQERLGLVAMDKVWDFGFRHIATKNKAIKTVGDLSGLRIRTPVDEATVTLFKSLKSQPLLMNLQDLMPALRANAIDAQESILPLILAANLHEILGACSLSYHTWDGQWLCFNQRSWMRLPQKLKETVSAAFNKGAAAQRADTMTEETRVRDELTKFGMTFNTMDPTTFRATLRSADYYAKARVRVGEDLWGLLEKYSGRLA